MKRAMMVCDTDHDAQSTNVSRPAKCLESLRKFSMGQHPIETLLTEFRLVRFLQVHYAMYEMSPKVES